MKSAITEFTENCILCNKPLVECHHTEYGNKNRSLADKYELVIPLCAEHHRGNMSVHQNKELMVMSHIIGQLAFEKKMCAEGMTEEDSRKEFMRVFGRSYL